MSKTFKTNLAPNKVLKVDELFGNPRLLIKELDGDTRGFVFAPSDTAELMLAIGDTLPVPDMVLDGSYEAFMATAIHCLAQAVKAQESEAAEAKAQAELEAEAFEYLKAVYTVTGAHVPAKFSDLNAGVQTHFLIIARRARELAQEGK